MKKETEALLSHEVLKQLRDGNSALLDEIKKIKKLLKLLVDNKSITHMVD